MAHHKVRHFKGLVSEDKFIAAGIIAPEEIKPVATDPVAKEIVNALKAKLSTLFEDMNEFKAVNYKIWMTGNPDYPEIIRRYRWQIELLTAPEMEQIDATPMGGW